MDTISKWFKENWKKLLFSVVLGLLTAGGIKLYKNSKSKRGSE